MYIMDIELHMKSCSMRAWWRSFGMAPELPRDGSFYSESDLWFRGGYRTLLSIIL